MNFRLPKTVLNAWDDEQTVSLTDSFKVLKNLFIEYPQLKFIDIGGCDKRLKKIIELVGIKFESI